MILVEKYKALALLAQVRHPKGHDASDSSFHNWRTKSAGILATIFGDESQPVREFGKIRWKRPTQDPQLQAETFRVGLAAATGLMDAAHDRIQTESDEQPPSPPPPPMPTPPPATITPPENKELSGRIFVVHGHDHGLKNAVARYIDLLGLKPIVLHEQPDRGQTVIEKFEREADVEFAVICATPDDVAGVAKALAEKYGKDVPFEQLMARARQNVIYELGFFVAKLGRSRVLLISDGVEIPSDLSGVIYCYRNTWQTKLWPSLKELGYKFDIEQIHAAQAIVA